MKTLWRVAVLCCSALAIAGCSTVDKNTVADNGPLQIAKQGSFFVGGQSIKAQNLSLLPRYAPKDGGTVSVNQMYATINSQLALGRRRLC